MTETTRRRFIGLAGGGAALTALDAWGAASTPEYCAVAAWRADAPLAVHAGLVDDGWKDVVIVMPGERVRVLMRFTDHASL